MARAVQLMEAAQRGVMAELQWLYASELGIEATDPDLMTIVERTVAGVADMDWQILAADDSARGYDKVLADEQKAFLEESYTACDNLPDAIEHLVMARFRGFAHLQPWTRSRPPWARELKPRPPRPRAFRPPSRPPWARELKLVYADTDGRKRWSRPPWARELKLVRSGCGTDGPRRTPRGRVN